MWTWIIFVLWAVVGILNLCNPLPISKADYFLVWLPYMIILAFVVAVN